MAPYDLSSLLSPVTNIVLLILNSLSVGYACTRIARTIDPHRLAGALLPLVLMSCAVLLLLLFAGAMGLLTVPMLTLGSGALLAFSTLGPPATEGIPLRGLCPDLRGTLTVSRAIERIAAGLVVAAVLPPIVMSMLLGPRFGTDELIYHATYPAVWTQVGSLARWPIDYHAYFPMNAELMTTWFLVHMGRDGLTGIIGAYWLIMLILGAWYFIRRLGGARSTSAVIISLICLSGTVIVAAGRFSAVDAAGPAHILAALVLTDLRHRHPSLTKAGPLEFTAGLVGGFALGCKITNAPAIAAIVTCLAVFTLMRGGPRAALGTLGRFLLGVLTTGGFWYIRNFIDTGNPLFPAAVLGFEGPFTGMHQAQVTLLTDLTAPAGGGREAGAGTVPGNWHAAIVAALGWPLPLGVVALLGFGAGWYTILRKPGDWHRDPHQVLVGLLAPATLSLLFFPFLPFSAWWDPGEGQLQLQLRFVILPFVVGLIALACLPFRWWISSRMVIPVVLVCLLAWERHTMWLVAGCAAALAVGTRAGCRVFSALVEWGKTGWHYGAMSILIALAVGNVAIQHMVDERLFGRGGRWSGTAWAVVDALPNGSRITGFGRVASYPLLGRDLQHRIIPTTPDGLLREPLHVAFQHSPDDMSWWPGERSSAHPDLLPNLARTGVDYVFVGRERSGAWPPEDAALSRTGRLVYHDSVARLWRMPRSVTTRTHDGLR